MNQRKPALLLLLLTLPIVGFADDKPVGSSTGVLLLAHGGAKDWNEEVDTLARTAGRSLPVEVAFGMASKRSMQDAIDRLVTRGVREIVAVPLFVSSHSSVITSTQYLLGLRPDAPAELSAYARMTHDHGAHSPGQPAGPASDPTAPVTSPVPIRMTAALDAHPLVAEILLSRARAISSDPAHETVVLVAHGPVSDDENAQWLTDMASLAGAMRNGRNFQRIEYLTVRDDAPEPIRARATAELRATVERDGQQGKVLVVPLLISYGGIERGIQKRLEGLAYVMSSQALLPDDRLVRWVEQAVAQSDPSVLAQGRQEDRATGKSPNDESATQSEVDQLREEVRQLRAGMEQLRALLESRTKPGEPVPVQAPQAALPTEPTLPNAPSRGATTQAGIHGTPQTTGLPEERSLALASKANGGDLSGAGNLLRTDRVAIGGYGDFQFRESGLNEKNDGGGTPTFQSTRFVLGIAAVLSQRQNIVFNSEIEYEFGAREVDVEQAFVDWKVRPEFSFRGGIFVPTLGYFNAYHDSNLNLTTLRPLIDQFILNTAYRDAGVGVRGRFNLPRGMKLSYEANILNGMQALDADGTPTPFSRLVGQSSASEPGLIAFQATNRHKAVTGRLGFSPILGLEVGASVYNGRINLLGEDPRSVTMLFYDGSYRRGPWAFTGEYARTNIVGGIPRQSPAPPVIDPLFPDTVAALARYVAQTTPGQDGFYVEGAYKIFPGFLRHSFDEGAYIAPVVRFEGIRRDRTLSNFYLNERRTALGLNIAPSPSVIFKLNYLFNNPQGKVPSIAGPFGGADFGNNPIPFLGYGRNGFTGSVAYVF